MNEGSNFGAAFLDWAQTQPSVQAIMLIGSRAKASGHPLDRPDAYSDWDFQLIVERPEIFFRPEWTRRLVGPKLQAYAVRTTAIGAVPKITAVFDWGSVDLVLIPVAIVRRVRWRVRFGLHRRTGWTRRRAQELSEVLQGGWSCLKDTGNWAKLYRWAETAVPYPWMDDNQIRQLAEAFVCEYVSARAKTARGEYHAGLRILTQELMETNYRLLHELRGRRKERSYRQARRLEGFAQPSEIEAVSVTAAPDRQSLRAATEKAALTCRELMRALVGDAWRWPDLTMPGD